MTCRTREVTLFPYTTLFRSVRLYAWRVVGTGAVATPVHRAVVGQAAQALRRHRALHRVEDGLHEPPGDQVLQGAEEGPGVVHLHLVWVAEIPGQAVEVTEHVAARA